MIWPIDPKTKEPSVSLAILILATTLVFVSIGLNLAGIAKNTDLVMEFFFGAAGLYWGRKFTSSKGDVIDALENLEKKLEEKGDPK